MCGARHGNKRDARVFDPFSRKKNTLSRERLKLLFKQHCEPQYGSITLKVANRLSAPLSGAELATPRHRLVRAFYLSLLIS